MPNIIEILIKASGQASVDAAVKQATGGLKTLQGGLLDLDSTLAKFGMGLGLAGLTVAAGKWVGEAVQAAAAEERLTRTFTNVAGGAEKATAYLDAMKTATKGQVSEGDLLATGMDVINLKLAQSPAQMEQYVAVTKRLGAEFGNLSFDEAVSGFNRIMESGSISARFLLSYGLSVDNVKARIKELQAADGSLSDTEATRQAVMAEAVATYNRLGPVQRDLISAQKEMGAAADDFKDSFGAMLLSIGGSTGIFDAATAALRRLQQGAEAWQGIFEAGGMATVQDAIAAQYATWDEYNRAQTLARNSMKLTESEFAILKGQLSGASGDVGVYTVKLGSASAATRTFTGDTAAATGGVIGFRDALDTAAKRADLARESAKKLATQGYKIDTSAIDEAINKFQTLINITVGWNPSVEMAGLQAANPYAGVNTWTSEDQAAWDERQRKGEQAAKETQREQEQTIKSIASALKSSISEALQPTEVTQGDFLDVAMGKYADKWDEYARRMRDISSRGALSAWEGWASIPPEIKAGGEKAVKEWADDQVQAFYSGLRPEAVNWDAFVKGYQAMLEGAAGRANLEETARQKIEAALGAGAINTELFKQAYGEAFGGEPTLSPMMQRLLGGTPDSFKGALSTTMSGILADPALFGGGKEGGEGAAPSPLAGSLAGNLAASMPGAIGAADVSGSMLRSINSAMALNKKDMEALANTFASGFNAYLPKAMNQSATVFLNALSDYVRSKLGSNPAKETAAVPVGGRP